MHCFGHIHEAWGGKACDFASKSQKKPSHSTKVHGVNSVLTADLPPLKKEADKEPIGWYAEIRISWGWAPNHFLSMLQSRASH
jgi:hypothetical protein